MRMLPRVAGLLPLAALVAAWVSALAGAPRASAIVPPQPPGCGGNTVTASSGVDLPIPDGGSALRDVLVGFELPFIYDLDVRTGLAHNNPADLDVTLFSPDGEAATLTTDNGGDLDGIFANVLWDDDAGDVEAPGPVTDTTFANGVAQATVVPEETLGIFRGQGTGGTWRLSMTDDTANGVAGTLTDVELSFRALNELPFVTRFTGSAPAVVPITAAATSTIRVHGLGSVLLQADAITRLIHDTPADLDVTLTSPAGTTVTLTTDNASGSPEAFSEVRWTDAPFGPAPALTDLAFAPTLRIDRTAPEEAMSAFVGENPNGIWTLTVADDDGAATGSIGGWDLELESGSCAEAPDLATAVSATPAAVTVGEDVTLTTTVSNLSPAGREGTGARVDVPVPAQTSLRSMVPSQGACDTETRRCDLGVILPGASATIVSVVRAEQAGSFAATAETRGTPKDPVPGNDRADTTVAVAAPAPTPAPPVQTVTVTAPAPPGTTPAPTVDATAPALARLLVPGQRLGTVRSRGLRVLLAASETATVTGTLTVSAATAKRLRLRSRTLGTVRRSVTAGRETTLTVKLTKAAAKALARPLSVTASLVVQAVDPAGNRSATSRRTVTLRR